MVKWLQRLWKAAGAGWGFYSFVTSEAFKAYIAPLSLTAIYVGLSLADGVEDWRYFYLGALVSFAAAAHGILRADEWRDRRRVEGRLLFRGLHLAIDKTADGSALAVVQLGFNLENKCSFPVSYTVTSIHTSVDHTLPSTGTLLTTGSTIAPSDVVYFRDRPIALKLPKAAMLGSLEFELTYGRVGNEKYKMSRKLSIDLKYVPATGVLHHSYLDTVRPVT